jgi:hypothetical protein
MHRLLERIDGAAATLVPLAYLAGMLIGTAAYFSGVVLEAGVAVGLALAFAVEVHGFLAQRRMRATWGQLARLSRDDPERERLTAQLRANVVVLAALILLSMYNGAAFLSHTWPIVPGFLPAGVQIAIRAVVLPVLFLASGFLTPLYTSAGDVLEAASREMLHRTVRATLKQWRQRIDQAQRASLDLAPVAVALMEDAGDTDGARRIRLIAAGLAAAEQGGPQAPVRIAPATRFPVALTGTETPTEGEGSKPTRPPTGPGSPAHARRRPASKRRGLGRSPILRLAPEGPEQRIRTVLADTPDVSIRQLAKRAETSQSAASKWARVVRLEATAQQREAVGEQQAVAQ